MTADIVFSHTGRDRPIVLTQHEVRRLSERAGRDVSADLVSMAGEVFEAKTLGQMMRALSVRLGTQRTWGDIYLSKVDSGMDHGSAALEADAWFARRSASTAKEMEQS